MALATALAGGIGTVRTAVPVPAPASTAAATVSEKRSLGCGAGAVELEWSSATPVQLLVRSSNAAGARVTVERPAVAGAHASASGAHTLTWEFRDQEGRPARPASRAACVSYF